MLNIKKIVSIFMGIIIMLLMGCIGIFAKSISIHESISYEKVSPDVKYYAEIDGVVRECTKEEYQKYGVKYYAEIDGELKKVTKDKFDELVKVSIKKEEEYLSKLNKTSIDLKNSNFSSNTLNQNNIIVPASLDQISNWSFTNMSTYQYKDSYKFNYSAGSSNQRITLNLKQWRSSGSTNDAQLRYQILKLNSDGTIAGYYGEQIVTGYYPDGSSNSKQIYFPMPYQNINNLVVRITSIDLYKVSGYGEAYNY